MDEGGERRVYRTADEVLRDMMDQYGRSLYLSEK